MSEIRVRIAPSPTGPVHVGTAYQALFDLAFARQHNGKFILRIEDTDQSRSRREYEDQLIEALRWLGLDWDEGPDVGGPCGPYRQSERLDIYQQHARQLIDAGHAYYCFCTPERLNELRAEQSRNKQSTGYDGHCRHLPATTIEDNLANSTPHVVRMKVPDAGTCIVKDTLRDPIEFDYATIDDQIILKTDGFPTYHLAVVVDDHLMNITHVIRGEEWIPSTPKHLLLYEYFGWEPTVYVHLPLLLNPDGSKMSKRRNPTSVDYYRHAGYLPQALLNYLARMAYPPLQGDEEKFSFNQFVEHFDFAHINLGGSIFDIEKLDWLNGRYIREDLSPTELLAEMKKWLLNDDYIGAMVPLLQPRMETLGDFMTKVAFFLSRKVEPTAEDLVPKKREADDVVQMMQTALWTFETTLPWNRETIEMAIRRVAEFWDWPVRDITIPLIAALTGQRVGPPLFESLELIGLDLTRQRLIDAMTVLGGLSKKKMSKLEKDWKK